MKKSDLQAVIIILAVLSISAGLGACGDDSGTLAPPLQQAGSSAGYQDGTSGCSTALISDHTQIRVDLQKVQEQEKEFDSGDYEKVDPTDQQNLLDALRDSMISVRKEMAIFITSYPGVSCTTVDENGKDFQIQTDKMQDEANQLDQEIEKVNQAEKALQNPSAPGQGPSPGDGQPHR